MKHVSLPGHHFGEFFCGSKDGGEEPSLTIQV
jgi:hypothetical protein